MKESEFEILRENCPWYGGITCKSDGNWNCNEKDCAVYYWIHTIAERNAKRDARLRKEILKTRCPG